MSILSVVGAVAPASQIFGVFGAGLLTGYSFSTSYSVNPVLLSSNLPTSKLVRLWDDLFEHGASFAKVMTPLSSAALFLAAYHRSHSHSFTPTVFGLHPSTQLTLSGALLMSGLPFTLLFIFPTSVYKLKERVAGMNQGKGSDKDMTASDKAGFRQELKMFGSRNAIRAGIWAVAFVLGLTVDV
ncbi:hypothetical protein FRB94_008776 [Tulasnella sp. JGI-2019a]|nr:hypothetical protein FRB93_008662 [Tulasnella sp. JGI-2019a]KAG8995749.1 hypothetical protein FRB94_008776 [Tulasnella sp. JGI-2019a]KAG9029913.1 hypothetical protein FRB95_004743 [Tulasnella sp. JGI-2019a]